MDANVFLNCILLTTFWHLTSANRNIISGVNSSLRKKYFSICKTLKFSLRLFGHLKCWKVSLFCFSTTEFIVISFQAYISASSRFCYSPPSSFIFLLTA